MELRRLLSRSNLLIISRLVIFLATIGILSWVSTTGMGRRHGVEPLTAGEVMVAQSILATLGSEAARSGTLLIGPRQSLDIKDGCNGVIAMILFIAAVLAHEASMVAKGVGLLMGLPIIWAVNLVRILSLYGIAQVSPDKLEFFHIYFWQTLIIIVVVVLWYLWASRVMPAPASSDKTAAT